MKSFYAYSNYTDFLLVCLFQSPTILGKNKIIVMIIPLAFLIVYIVILLKNLNIAGLANEEISDWKFQVTNQVLAVILFCCNRHRTVSR